MPPKKHELAPAPTRAPTILPPPDIRGLLGPPPLLDGEDRAAFEALYRHVRTKVAPSDVLEEIWVRDVVDNLWETLRMRRLKVTLMRASAHEGLNKLLEPLVDSSVRDELVSGWAKRERESVREVDAALKQAGLNQDAITAQTLAVKLDTFERIEKLIMQAEMRRSVILREIDRHRDVVAQRLREVAAQIEDAQFR